MASAVDVRDQIKAFVIPKLLASEGGFRQLHTVELAVLAVGEINKGRPPLASQGDGHLIGKLLAAHVFELREETRGSPAIKATAIHVGRAV